MPRKKRTAGRKAPGRVSPRKAAAASASAEVVPETDDNVETNVEEMESEDASEEVAQQEEEEEEVVDELLDLDDPIEENLKVEEPEAIAEPTATTSSAEPSIPLNIPTEVLDDKNSTNTDHWTTLVTDKESLVDTAVGYRVEENLKQPLKCFTSDDETQLFPVIETMSAKLYNIVQRMTASQRRDVDSAIKARKGVIKFQNLRTKAYLCHLNSLEPPSETGKFPPNSKRAPHPFLLTEDENMFTEDKLKKLRAVLDAGWKREVVMRSPGSTGRKTGDVYYYSPNGTKFRSSKQVAQFLAQRKKDNPFTIDNFSFAKVRISMNPEQEIVRKAYDGNPPRRGAPVKTTPPKGKPAQGSKGESSKAAPKPSTSKDGMESRAEEPVKGVSSRRSIQPPKRYSGDAVMLLSKRPKIQDDKRNSNNKGLMQMGMLPPKYPKGMEDTSSNLSETGDYNETGSSHEDGNGPGSSMKELAEDSLFAISALRQSGGIDVEKMHQYVENQKKLAMKAQAAGVRRSEPGPRPGRPTPGGSKGSQSVIPCSIRCPGMTGVVPNLQCTRCLCLFHAECLGLPPNLLFKQYLCSNCTDQGAAPSTATATTSVANSQKHVMKKPSEMKRAPPEMLPLPPHRRAPVPGRDITVTLTGKERMPVRLPPKVGPSHPGMVRGMMRPRGGAMGHHVRSPGQRMIASEAPSVSMMSANQHQMMRRGRGRPPGVPVSRIPPQINKNLTITQLPRPRLHAPPPVPNLQPMRTPKPPPNKVPLPHMAQGKPRQVIPVPNLMKSNAFRVSVPPPSLSGRTFKKVSPPASQHHTTNLRLQHPQGAGANRTPQQEAYSTVSDRSVPMVKRCPQTICMIGNQKYVVLPKKTNNRDFSPATTVTPVGNGGLSKGNYTISETIRAPPAPIKRIGDNDVTVTEHIKVYNRNNDHNVSNATQNEQNKVNNMSMEEDIPSADDEDQMLSYGDGESAHNSDEHHETNDNNGNDTDGGAVMMQDGILTDAVGGE